MADMTRISRALAEEWTRKLLTVLHLSRQEEAKGGHLPHALDLFVKDLTGEANSVHPEAFHAGLERSVMYAVRYFDGSTKCREISPGVSCKEVEDATHDLLEQVKSPVIAESPSGEPAEGSWPPSQGDQKTARRKDIPRSGDESGRGKFGSVRVPEGRKNGSDAPCPGAGPEPLSPQTFPRFAHEGWTQTESRASNTPAEPFGSPTQSNAGKMRPEMEPCAVVVYPAPPGEGESGRRARVIYPMTPVVSTPARHPSPPVPLSLTLSAIMCALPTLVPGAPGGSPADLQHPEECDSPRSVPPARRSSRSHASGPSASPMARGTDSPLPGSCKPEPPVAQPHVASGNHPVNQCTASVGGTVGTDTLGRHAQGPGSAPEQGSAFLPPASPSESSSKESGPRGSESPNDSRHMTWRDNSGPVLAPCKVQSSSTGSAAQPMTGVPHPAVPWYHYPSHPAVCAGALSPNRPATRPFTETGQTVGAEICSERPRGPESTSEQGSPRLSPLSSSKSKSQTCRSKGSESPKDTRHTGWRENSRLVPPPTRKVRTPSTRPAAPPVAGVPHPTVPWYPYPPPPVVCPVVLSPNRPVTRPFTGMGPPAGADIFCGHPQGPASSSEQESPVLPPSSSSEPTAEAGGLTGPESPNHSRHTRCCDDLKSVPSTCNVQSSATGPVAPPMAGVPHPAGPWYHYPIHPAAYPGVLSPTQPATRLFTRVVQTSGAEACCGRPQGPGPAPEEGSPVLPPRSLPEPRSQAGGPKGLESPNDSQHTGWRDNPRSVMTPTCDVQSYATQPVAPPMAGVPHPAFPCYRYPTPPPVYPVVLSANRPSTLPFTEVGQMVGADAFCGHPRGPSPTPEQDSPVLPPPSPLESPNDSRHTGWRENPRPVPPPTRNVRTPSTRPAAPPMAGVSHPTVPWYPCPAPPVVYPGFWSPNRPVTRPFTGMGPPAGADIFCGHPQGPGSAPEQGPQVVLPPSASEPTGQAFGLKGPESPNESRHTGCRDNLRPVLVPTYNIQSCPAGPAAPPMAGVPHPAGPWYHYPAPQAVYPGILTASQPATCPFTGVVQTVSVDAFCGHPRGPGSVAEQDSPVLPPLSPLETSGRAGRPQGLGVQRAKGKASRGIKDSGNDPRSMSKGSSGSDLGSEARRHNQERHKGVKRMQRRDRQSSL